jgi:uncharacterized protein (DUF58 family)
MLVALLGSQNFASEGARVMALVRNVPGANVWLSRVMTTDFCPWANRYIYWLKEPVGWFALALVASLLVGAFLSPLGWSVATGLATVIVLGLGFPWLATRCVRCELRPVDWELRERQDSYLSFSVANYLPLPITGLRIEGYFSEAGENAEGIHAHADCALALVPAFSRATYRLPLRPEYRGRYPTATPEIACSFPFGIWTARRSVENVLPVLVRPLHIPLLSDVERVGSKLADHGPGNRPSTHGDFQGVRDFRDGDSLKSIHWAQSARNDRLVVCERGGPQQQTVDVELSTARSLGTNSCARENLAWRVRVAASVSELLCARHIPFRLWIDDQLTRLPAGPEGARRARDLLADVPLDGCPRNSTAETRMEPSTPTIRIHAWDGHGNPLSEQAIGFELITPGLGFRRTELGFRGEASGFRNCGLIDLDQDIIAQLDQLLSEAGRASFSA